MLKASGWEGVGAPGLSGPRALLGARIMGQGGNGVQRSARLAVATGAVLFLAAGLSCLPAHAALNDTGMDEFANEAGHGLAVDTTGYPGQDARHGRDAAARAGRLKKTGGGSKGFDFTKLDAAGAPLPAKAAKWICVRDNVTGLIWEVKTADRGLRDMWSKYSWYNPDPAVNGGGAGVRNAGTCTGGIDCDTYSYVQAVNAQKLCGYSDWRLPERRELRSIVDFGKSMDTERHRREQFQENDNNLATIDSNYFPHTPTHWFWSATPFAEHPDYAWRVFFFDGGDAYGIKEGGRVDGTPVYVRLVRGRQ